jgi:uncharacterized protein (TIGR02466 family)
MAHYTPKVGGRINVLKYGEADTPHDHVAKALVVGVYYLEVYPNCGDLLLHDPRGGVAWKNLNFEPDDPLPRTSRTYHRFKPQEGMMILFPSYLVHSVETNLTDKNRISLVLHI